VKLAISNIAWQRSEDAVVAELMAATGVNGLELAPTAVWPDPLVAAAAEVDAVRDWWMERGITVVALQALLFGRPELQVFGDAAVRAATLDHLEGMMVLAARLGAGPLVFGSPKNRIRGEIPMDEALEIATEFFREAGRRAEANGVVLCVEPNPKDYGCDFVTTAAEGMRLVQAVAHPGFALHLDAGALTLNKEIPAETIGAAVPLMRHFHASEPHLAALGTGGTDHDGCAAGLRAAGYSGWVSVEMRRTPDGAGGLAAVLARLVHHYGR
jgi:sugar phosphate isomerase/epimerase